MHIQHLSEFVAAVALLAQEAAQLAAALVAPDERSRAAEAAQLAQDAAAHLDSLATTSEAAEDALTTAIWALGLAAVAVTEAKLRVQARPHITQPA